jgi:two-component system, cell cycle sensor histidine kinase and response regulator CckA
MELSVSEVRLGNRRLFTGIVRDISERKRMEAVLAERDKQLRQSQKLEAVGSLAGGIAHEFNNLLQAIRGYTKLAMEAIPSDAQPRQDLEQVEKSANRASVLTRQLLGFSRHQIIERVVLDPSTVIGELVKLLRPLISEDIEVEVSLGDDVGTLQGDPCLLQEMFLNLCINARDAMPAGGRLFLKTEQVTLSEAYCESHSPIKAGSYVVFSVADSGCGISAEVKDRVFEPFFTTKEVGLGTGLGLSMVYGTVQQHGGTISLYSELGIGTTFKIYLPTAGVSKVPVQGSSAGRSRGGSETILLAEDDPVVRQLAERILRQAGYTLLIAADGAQAIELFETHADIISLALLDAVMPKRTGREIYEQIKRDKPDLPVVICTGYDADLGQLRFLKENGLRWIQKPFDQEVLLSCVRDILDTEQVCGTAPCLH